MADTNIIELKNRLENLGFGKAFNEVALNIKNTNQAFTVFVSNRIADDFLMYALKFKRDNNNWQLINYNLTKMAVTVPKAVIAGINVNELESRLIRVDEITSRYYAGNERKGDSEIAALANKDLERLYQLGDTSKEITQVMMFKYWPENEWAKYITNSALLKENYVTNLEFTKTNELPTADMAYAEINKLYFVQKREDKAEDYFITDSLFEQAQFELSFSRNWVAYNRVNTLLQNSDVKFFSTKEDVINFCKSNNDKYADYGITHTKSIYDFISKIPFDDDISKSLNNYSILKTNVMNNENLQYLTDNIKYMGFGENHKADLEKSMAEGKAEFQLVHKAEINKKPFEATMNFRKSDSTDMYFFNNYHASLEKGNGEKAEQTFYLNKGKGVTGKEAYNLLDGRSVQKDLVTKEGQPYKAWIQLDTANKDKNNNFEVKQYHENYGYDLKTAVEKFAVAEMKDPEKEKVLMQSLQKGNVQSVTIEKDGSSHKMFIEADPQYKKVTLYDANMKMVAKESLEQYKSGIDKGSKAVKEDLADDKKKDLKQAVKPDKKNDKTLLPKKREHTKKGLGVS